MSVVVVTTISCDAVIERCSSCQTTEVAISSAAAGGDCRTCGAVMLLDRRCGAGFSLDRGGILIRCIAENKDGWHCEDRGAGDFCAEHAHLADRSRIAQPTARPRALEL